MGLVSSLLVGGLVGGALLGARAATRDRDGQRNLAGGRRTATPEEVAGGIRPRPPGAQTVGTAIPRDEFNRRRAAGEVDATNPPDASLEESSNVGGARSVAQRTRRRAAAGHAGRVTTGTSSSPGITAGGTPRTLIGY